MNIKRHEFDKLAFFLKSKVGINLEYSKKKNLVITRLRSLLEKQQFNNFEEYFNYIIQDKTGEGIRVLVNRLTTNYSYFYREPEHFEFLQKEILPYLAKNIEDKDIRIWSAGSSTGEEPFTLAMTVLDFFGLDINNWDTTILATDISSDVINTAIKGIYNKDKVINLPNEWVTKYFKKYDDENYILKDRVKDQVIFRRFNLIEKKYPFKKKFHVIFCRNVMIYFDNETRNETIKKFCNHLNSGGYLIIGHSETINRDEVSLKYIKPSIYRKE